MLQDLTNGDVVWESKYGTRGSISSTLLQSLCAWKQDGEKALEAGGVLLGYIDIESNGLLACEISTPGFGDKRSRYGFYRGKWHQKEIDRWNRCTQGNGTLTGLWHTHPEIKPTPSALDRSDCFNVLCKGSYSHDGLLYLIVGLEYIGVWFAVPQNALELLGYISIR